ncbi:MAG: phosphoglycerate dehydrogenase [Proteobacteria bacterium]|nr:phosphoglycerate dehydrogenase [Pseudomonadota bacterium]
MRTKVLITGQLHAIALEGFRHIEGIDVVYKPDLKFEELLPDLVNTHVLVSRSETDVDKRLIDASPQLKIIARAAVGIGNIDIDYATERGILVVNTPGKNTNSAAELTLGLILAMLRKIPEAQNKVKAGGWDRHRYSGFELRGKKLGIVGLGNVGHRVARFCLAFDCEVFAYDPYISPNVFSKHGVTPIASLAELADKVDILTLHVPKNKETNGMIDRAILKALGPKSYFVNAARGGVVDEKDLLWALNEKIIAGAAVDTFEAEPKPWMDLVQHPHLYCTPHIGASTEEAQIAIGVTIVEQIRKALEGGVVDYHVNLPNVGVIDKPILKAYSTLAEKLGSIIGQTLDFNPKSVQLVYRGDIAELDNSILRLSWMKGFATQVVDDYVSFVNVGKHIDRLGIEVTESTDASFASYNSALKIVVRGAQGQHFTIGGVVFEERHDRLTLYNDFHFEVEASGYLILIENLDRPGVIGDIGQYLARQGINISSFNLSRNRKGGKAMAIITVDSQVPPALLKGLKELPHIESAKALFL